ncbi:hypothetical protein NADFUDRAFT_68527 [Nadsonia fulvescens var. elongata DSM 6958]|uniref:ATPase inhibitor, mitochondrial n=1 Tax=Nadsonia fulvescens var. elongata DSM 6958 TaxID=857566 RepID=A0A1E3PSK4_9ASCO|nr:hypothetical protein NADFUDRAFT_68527 [Nadsonia fulvescens var. elongata DSM 6958]
MLSATRLATRRAAFSPIMSIRPYSDGATGAPRPSGKGDSFTSREKGAEDYYVRKHEAEQLAALREKLKAQKEHVSDLESQINDLTKKQ